MPRIGDTVDDHCSRCKRTTDHSVMAMVGEDPAKVVCRTCNSEHKYRGNKTGKKPLTKEEAFAKLFADAAAQVARIEDTKPKRKR